MATMKIMKQKQSVWSHLVDKPTEEDIKYELETSETQSMSSRAEVWSWYMVDFGTTPIVLVIVAMIFPVYTVILATQYGCQNNTPFGCDYENNPINSDEPVTVYIGSTKWKPESFATLMIALSGVLQCIAYLFISAIADYSHYQHYMFRLFTFLGCLMLIICVTFNEPKHYQILGIWGALMLVPIGLAQIFYNAYLPVLVENHWSIRRLQRKCDLSTSSSALEMKSPNRDRTSIPTEQELDRGNDDKDVYKSELQSTQDGMSQFGICIGYVGGLIATIISAVILFMFVDSNTHITDTFGISSAHMQYTEEYWMKRVIGVHVWYTNDSFGVNAMQFIYEKMNGSIHGNIENNAQFVHLYFAVSENDYINKVILYYSTDTNMIHSMSMSTYNENEFIFGNIANNSLAKQVIISDNFPKHTLAGYATHSDAIISAYSFAFMDNNEGQYGNNYDNLGVFAFVGFWCLLFSIPSFCILAKRTKPALPKTSSLFTVSVKSYWNSFKTARSYPNLFRTLIAWFIWSDAENTIGAVGVLFAQKELNMNGVQLILLVLEMQLLASIGGVFFVWLQTHTKLTSKNLVIIHLCINCVLPIWTMFGLIESSPIGLKSIIEVYVIVGLLYASQLGSLFSASRSLFGHLIPIGDESKYFGLYAVTDKGSSWIGPLIAAFIANAYSLRYALIYVLLFFVIAIPILQFGVDYDEGLRQAGKLDLVDVIKDDNADVDEDKSNVIEMQQI